MPELTVVPPARRSDLVVRPLGDDGRYVIKDPRSGAFFAVGEAEHFLLEQLDGERSGQQICAEFQRRFGEPLSTEELDGFLALARSRDLLAPDDGDRVRRGWAPPDPAKIPTADLRQRSGRPALDRDAGLADPRTARGLPHAPLRRRQSLLYWRKSLFDPDRLFTWLQPKLWFFWTRGFVLVSAACILAAAGLVWANAGAIISRFEHALRWETLAAVWLASMFVTTCHEFAHGMTCKRYGGEVHELGFLAMFLMPCFYCNVSDAWLFREKSKRLWVTLAGGYFELFLWALAVFLWRLTLQDTLVNYVAWVVLSLSGLRVFFNFNPLLKFDGYYLLSDLTETPNLRQRSLERFTGTVRWLLWGAPRPAAERRSRFLLFYGLACWLFSVGLLTAMAVALGRFLHSHVGVAGPVLAGCLWFFLIKGLFRGLTGSEVTTMIRLRRKRTLIWCAVLVLVPAAMFVIPWQDRAGGSFEVRALHRAEVRAAVAGFLREVHFDQGERVDSGALVARLEVPDLDSQIWQKRAELQEAEAQLQMAETGPRPIELKEQRARVERVEAWRNLAEEEQEVARREKELADARSNLTLLEAGTRPEKIDAARARVARLKEELEYLTGLQKKQAVRSPLGGVVVTPFVREKIGRYFQEGDLVCEIDDHSVLLAEIAVSEQEAARIRRGQAVELKARSLPFETFEATVERIAPNAAPGEVQSDVIVYCRLENGEAALRPGMSGYARIYAGRRSIGTFLCERIARFFRTEFWW